MDGSEAEAAFHRLLKGKYIDVAFDIGEDKAAADFARKVPAYGLIAELCPDEPLSWSGSRPRPLFLKLSVAVLAGFGVCLWLFSRWPHASFTRVSAIAEGFVLIFWLYSGSGGLMDRKPRSEAEKEWHRKLGFWWSLGLTGGIILISGIIASPAFGLALLIVAVGGIVCAILIRATNRQ